MLSLVSLWTSCLETVKTVEATECYGIVASDFMGLFSEDSKMIQEMQKIASERFEWVCASS